MSKKSSKKLTKEVPVATTYEPSDVVLGKVKGYPPWPGMVVDESKIPANVLKEKPGKKTLMYCVQFFPGADYAWLDNRSISKLQKSEIESFIHDPFKKSNDLLTGYRIALDPRKWEDDREAALLAADVEEDEEEQEDELDEDGEKPKGKKRKRESDAGGRKKKAKGGKSGKKSKETVESEEDGEGDEEPAPEKESSNKRKSAKKGKEEDKAEDELSADPEAVKVREWRHKLQKTFLSSNKTVPKDEDMPSMHELFSTVESYDKMDIAYLSFSKIGKVMRHIAALPIERVPRDDEFKFRDRSQALVDRWGNILNANGNTSATKEEKADAVNGNAQHNGDGAAAPDGDADAGVGEVSMLGDVTMSEAGGL